MTLKVKLLGNSIHNLTVGTADLDVIMGSCKSNTLYLTNKTLLGNIVDHCIILCIDFEGTVMVKKGLSCDTLLILKYPPKKLV